MERHFHDELNQVKQKTLRLGSLVEDMVERAVTSLVDRDSKLAEETIAFDDKVDHLEVRSTETVFAYSPCTNPPPATCDSSPPP